jgi:hypothetical protein
MKLPELETTQFSAFLWRHQKNFMENHNNISFKHLQTIATLVKILGSGIQTASTNASNDFETSATCSGKQYIHLNKKCL